MDKYAELRNLHPLTALAALGIDISLFKKRSNKPEWFGKCPIHQSKNNNTCFSINEDGRYQCFSCSAKGKGMVDLAMAVRNLGFQAAVEFLGSVPPPPKEKAALAVPIASGGV